MKLDLIKRTDESFAKEKLDNYYEGGLLPAEKKLYLTKLKASHGPFMGIEVDGKRTHYLMDAASQIATLGLGFNSSVFMGPSHFLESWTNENHTESVASVRKGFESFLKRKTGWDSLHTTFCNSGAEANEIALGYCYRARKNAKANKVLAFKGSFHGRMLVSLQATWNPSKREPFLFPGFECAFTEYPELQGDDIHQEAPSNWHQFWEKATQKNIKIPADWEKESVLKEEVRCLSLIRDELLKGEIFSIIVEPMQCEGGDRYASGRFHSALLLLARSFGIGVIHDEVQTGFHLGREFFWHKMLKLEDGAGNQLNPNYVVCAKKAQIGLVLSHGDETLINQGPEEYSVVSMIRGYFHAVSLDQAQNKIINMEETCRGKLSELIEKHAGLIERPRLMGLSFAFDLCDKEKVTSFIGARFDHGLLYYPAGDKTLRFRLNTAFSSKDINFLFERLDQLVGSVLGKTEGTLVDTADSIERNPENLYEWTELLLDHRLKGLNQSAPSPKETWSAIERILTGDSGLVGSSVVRLNKENFSQYKDDIQAIQKEVYETERQTSLETFEKAVSDNTSVAILLLKDKKIEAMAISGTASQFPTERILRRDPGFNNPDTLYMVDCTVRPGHQGKGLGRQIKSALNLLAMSEGKEKIVGRNRDRMAGAMLSINLGLGAKEEFYVPEDYPDFEEHRDVFFYNNELKWNDQDYRLDNALTSPLDSTDLTKEFLIEQLPYLTNKVCLSNFVSIRYLDHFKKLMGLLPSSLRHGYSASGQSECVDKISKSLFVADSDDRVKMISFKGHYFGLGSFMSRSLSLQKDGYFPATHFDSPNEKNWEEVLKAIVDQTNPKETLAVWIEPLPQNILEPVPLKFLQELRKWTKENKINLVFNETAAAMNRFNADTFCASNEKTIEPDAGFIFMGGQAGIVFTNESNFMSKPLMMISTWDGDEFSYGAYLKALDQQESSQSVISTFTEKLIKIVNENNISEFNIHNGVGTIKGDLPFSLTSLMTAIGHGRYKFIPSLGAMKKFNERY
ncbi:MAG: acetylornithine/succinyldiaminopimelate/putrescine aminotransferase [Bacteriovoracaceae bacterium]|jgi:acetylornithine/succinyldiaminopimelate/putrescine aminotransferase